MWTALLAASALLMTEADLPQLYSEAMRSLKDARYGDAKNALVLLQNHPNRAHIPPNMLQEIHLALIETEVEMGQTGSARARLHKVEGFEHDIWLARLEYREGNTTKGWQQLCALKMQIPLEQWPLKHRLFYLSHYLEYTAPHG